MHDSLLTHARYRYLWVALILCVGSIVAYVWHQPIGVPNGGTWLGYTLGTIAAVLIVWLMLFGIRKRSYRNRMGSLRGWLSAHVYLGTSLLVVSLLHSGFQFGWNLHTFTWALMMVVIVSGFIGVYAYARYPTLMTRNRDSQTRQAMLDEIANLDQAALNVADKVAPQIHSAVLRSIEQTKLGGGVWSQLTSRDRSDIAISEARQLVEQYKGDEGSRKKASGNTMVMMVDFLAEGATNQQADQLRKLIDLLTRKKNLASQVARDIQLQAAMEIWLYFHVPLSFALLAALTGHIVSVFFYW